jgi:hypothetical protein
VLPWCYRRENFLRNPPQCYPLVLPQEERPLYDLRSRLTRFLQGRLRQHVGATIPFSLSVFPPSMQTKLLRNFAPSSLLR